MSILENIGNTPLEELKAPGCGPATRILAKLEWFNPGGSIKDRAALNIINKGFSSGQLTREKTVIEASTGSMAVSLAMVCAAFGLELELIMPDDTGEEFRGLVEGYGAKITFTQAEKGIDQALKTAYDIVDRAPDKYFMANQFNNGANPQAHFETTAPEIIEQAGSKITHLVAGMGTTGTLMGAGRRLRKKFPEVQVIGVEPKSPHNIQGLRTFHDIILPGVFDKSKLNQIIDVSDREAAQALEVLHKENSILAGPSSGAAFHAAIQVAREAPQGSLIITIFPDGHERYLNSGFYSFLK